MKLSLFGAFFLLAGSAQAQTSVIVNPDGTHSTLIKTGGSAIVVNPDGTHSPVHNVESNTPVVINSDGSQTTLQRTANQNIIINTDDSQTARRKDRSRPEPALAPTDSTRPAKPARWWRANKRR